MGCRRRSTTYGLAAESDALLRVEDRALPDEGLDAACTTVDLVKRDLADDLVAVLSADDVNMFSGAMRRQ